MHTAGLPCDIMINTRININMLLQMMKRCLRMLMCPTSFSLVFVIVLSVSVTYTSSSATELIYNECHVLQCKSDLFTVFIRIKYNPAAGYLF